MTPRRPRAYVPRTPLCDEDDGAWGESHSLTLAGLAERDALAAGFEPMARSQTADAKVFLPPEVLKVYTRQVPIIAMDPHDQSLHVDGTTSTWAPRWFALMLKTVRARWGNIALRGLVPLPAHGFVTAVLRDEALQRSVTALCHLRREDLALEALHNLAAEEGAP